MLYLGVDFGMKRVGLAISEGELASPVTVLSGNGFDSLSKQIIDFAKRKGADLVVVGVPDGGIGKMARKLIVILKKNGLNVVEGDENLSSKNATLKMIELGTSKKDRAKNDAYSASEILQNYLDNKL